MPDNSKPFWKSARFWGSVGVALGVVAPSFGVQPTEYVEPLKHLGNQGVATLGAASFLVSLLRRDGKKIRWAFQ